MTADRRIFPTDCIVCVAINSNKRVFTQANETVHLVDACAAVKTAGRFTVVNVRVTEPATEAWLTIAFKIADKIFAELCSAHVTRTGSTFIDFHMTIRRGPSWFTVTRVILPATKPILTSTD